jgi:hypothetical protein
MNPAALQKVFGAIAQQAPAAPAYQTYNQNPAGVTSLAGLLGQPAGYQGYGGQQRPAQQGAPTQQVQDIMAQLAALSKKPS